MNSDPDQREIATFICSHVFTSTHPVLLVAREQGDWMFLCGEMHYGDDDYHVAGRNHLLERDPTLHQVLDLDNGWEAERGFVGGPWTRRIIDG
jgi:hypothetical protein